jgi:hypothetical protein
MLSGFPASTVEARTWNQQKFERAIRSKELAMDESRERLLKYHAFRVGEDYQRRLCDCEPLSTAADWSEGRRQNGADESPW